MIVEPLSLTKLHFRLFCSQMEKYEDDRPALNERSNIIYVEVSVYYLVVAVSLCAVLFLATHDFKIWHPILYMLAFFSIGWSQFCLNHALHEALHKNFGKKHNEFLAALITAYPIGFTMGYRRIHLDHHRYFGDKDNDPDYGGYCNFPKSKMQFLGRLLYNISGIPAVLQFFKEHTSPKKKEERAEKEKEATHVLFKLAAVHLVILSLFILIFMKVHLLAGFFSYGFFWVLPLVTVAKFCNSTRLLCEHGSPKNQLVYRTITGNFFQTQSLGAFKFYYHGEHHIKPNIPYTKLKDAKETLNLNVKNKNIVYEEYNHGYLSLLIKWFREVPLIQI